MALGLTAILGGIAGAAFGVTVFGEGSVIERSAVLTAAIVGVVVLCIAYFVGGWSAGRIARYNGVRNGIVAAVWTLICGAVVAAAGAFFGDRYDALAGVAVPNWATGRDAMAGGAIGAVVAIALMFLFAGFGGRRGETYHRHADAFLTEPRPHGA